VAVIDEFRVVEIPHGFSLPTMQAAAT
jgi:hypothetical protein